MPDILRLRYVGAAPVAVPVLGRDVEPDCIVEVPGRIVTDVDHAADCFLAETGNPPELRAWPTSLWRDETPTKKPAKE